MNSLLRLILRLLFRFRAFNEGALNTPGPVLLIPNHVSWFDWLFIGVCLDDSWKFVTSSTTAEKSWFHRFVMKNRRTFPIDNASPYAVKHMAEFLSKGGKLVLFAEGRLSRTGTLMKLFDGTGFLIHKTHAKVITAYLRGASRLPFSPNTGWKRCFPTVTTHFSDLLTAPHQEHLSTSQSRALFTRWLRDQMVRQQFDTEMAFGPATLPAAIAEAAAAQPGKVVLEDATLIELTYRKLLVGARLMGDRLARECRATKHVGVMLPNVNATPVVLLALWQRGLVPAILNFSTGTPTMLACAELAGLKHIVTSRAFLQRFKLAPEPFTQAGIQLIYLEDVRASIGTLDRILALLHSYLCPFDTAAPRHSLSPNTGNPVRSASNPPTRQALAHPSEAQSQGETSGQKATVSHCRSDRSAAEPPGTRLPSAGRTAEGSASPLPTNQSSAEGSAANPPTNRSGAESSASLLPTNRGDAEGSASPLPLHRRSAESPVDQKPMGNSAPECSGVPSCLTDGVTHPPEHHATAVILFTSGSEGVPKGVELTHRNLLSNARQMLAVCDLRDDERFFNAMPMFHSFGLLAGTILPLIRGHYIFIYPSPLHYRVVPTVFYDKDCTVLFGTNTFLSGYGRKAHPYDFRSLRYLFAGAEKLQSATAELWAQKFGVRVLEGYGATECSPAISATTPLEPMHGTAGRFLPGVQWRLEAVEGIGGAGEQAGKPEGESGVTHPPSVSPSPHLPVVGRLFVKGPNIMKGYLNPDANAKFLAGGGWYDTGDIVFVDAEGFVSIRGRMKRFAKISGEMVSLTAVEDALAGAFPQYGLRCATAVVTRPDEDKGEALICCTNEPKLTLGEIRDAIKAKGLSNLCVPKEIAVVKEIPKLGTGKVNHRELQAMVVSNK